VPEAALATSLLRLAPKCLASTEGAGGRTTLFQKDRHMATLITRFVSEDSGQDLIEYGLLIGIITTGAITAISAIGPKVSSYFSSLDSSLP
jgi:pilus assembly protein Flp/PilA